MNREAVGFAVTVQTVDEQKSVAGHPNRRVNKPDHTARRADDDRLAVPNEADIVL